VTYAQERVMQKRILLALAAALGIAGGISACNTIEGVGKDVEGAGEATQDASKEVKKDIKKKQND
jgi:predicted small secreted protein